MPRQKQPDSIAPEELREICELLYAEAHGDRWQTVFAEDLGRARGRELRNGVVNAWLSGKRTVPPWVRQAVTDLVFATQVRLVERSQRLYERGMRLVAEARDMAQLELLSSQPDRSDDDERYAGVDLGDQPAKPKPAPARKPKRVLEPSK